MAYSLLPFQREAVNKLKSGKILLGGVGTGKTITSLSFYLENYKHLKLYVITTPAKRDEMDWEYEANLLGIDNINVDSWNNIKKYLDVANSFFIFDEHKLSNYGTWGKSFIRIAKKNYWILASATPGDTWMDYLNVFIATGKYRNKTEFNQRHVIFSPYHNFPVIKEYKNELLLIQHRNDIIVEMKSNRVIERKHNYIYCDYDKETYRYVVKNRWNIYEEKPVENASEYCRLLRRISVTNKDRENKLLELLENNKRVIIFYQYNYEKDIILNITKDLNRPVYQRNKLVHDPVPEGDEWIYVVNYYNSEAWNCIKTNVIIFYSLNYSYKSMEQARGRIDRINTYYSELRYYYLLSKSHIEDAILTAINKKKKFNEESFI